MELEFLTELYTQLKPDYQEIILNAGRQLLTGCDVKTGKGFKTFEIGKAIKELKEKLQLSNSAFCNAVTATAQRKGYHKDTVFSESTLKSLIKRNTQKSNCNWIELIEETFDVNLRTETTKEFNETLNIVYATTTSIESIYKILADNEQKALNHLVISFYKLQAES